MRQRVIQLLSGYAGGPMVALGGDLVDKTDVPVCAATLLADTSAVLRSSATLADARRQLVEVDGVIYETCTYRPGPLPEISMLVAGARVTPEAFDDYSRRLAGTERIDGLGDAATYTTAYGSLRVLAGSTLFVIQVRNHRQPRDGAIAAAQRALASIASQPPPDGSPLT